MIPSVRESVFSAAIFSSSMGSMQGGGEGTVVVDFCLLLTVLRRDPRIVSVGGLGVSNRHVV